MASTTSERAATCRSHATSTDRGASHWGFVAGKTQTIYPWDTWVKTYKAEPPVWFHDIFRADGSVYDRKEVEYIKSVTGKGK